MNRKTKPAAPETPPLYAKILFWLTLGALSVILAEVVTASSPYPFFDSWGLLVTYPLYTLHTLVLAALIFRKRRVNLVILFLAGAIFGLYEAYITKVLWSPTWGDTTFTFAGIHVVQTAVLVLFWHPFMGFIVPLLTAERFFTRSRETFDALPARLRSSNLWWLWIGLFAAYCGIVESVAAPDISAALTSIGGAVLVFGVLAFFCYRVCRRYTLRMLLPSNTEAIILAVVLVINYIWQTLLVRAEALPTTLMPHLTIWVIYALVIVLLYFNLKNAPPFKEANTEAVLGGDWRAMLLFWVVFGLSAALFVLAKSIGGMVVLASWALGVLIGLLLMLRAALVAFRTRAEKSK